LDDVPLTSEPKQPTPLSGLLWAAERIDMFSRMRQRLARLEQAIIPKGRVFTFLWYATDATPGSYAEQLAAFKARNGVGLRDKVVEVRIMFGA
jgi:hypothetical protein